MKFILTVKYVNELTYSLDKENEFFPKKYISNTENIIKSIETFILKVGGIIKCILKLCKILDKVRGDYE